MSNTVKKYKNPVAGMQGVFGGNYPAELTREELIKFAAEHAVGSSHGISGDMESFFEWIGESTGEEVDFEYDDLTIKELQIVDEIVFECNGCGWNCSTDEKFEHDDEIYCSTCYKEVVDDED